MTFTFRSSLGLGTAAEVEAWIATDDWPDPVPITDAELAKNKALKLVTEIVTVEVPSLIDQPTFNAVQTHLRARNPRVTPARAARPSLSASPSAQTAAAP